MIKANALFIVVVIALVIGILCSSLILVAYHHRLHIQENILLTKLETNANSAINILLSEGQVLSENQQMTLDLFGNGEDSVTIKKINWGLFDVGCVRAFTGKYRVVKAIQYGYKPDNFSTAAIYLVDQNRPISIGGKTILKGDCYLPEAGIERAYIEGKSFEGTDLVKGTVKKSTSSLPPLNKSVLTDILYFIKANKNALPEEFEVVSDLNKDTVIRSYYESTLVIFNQESIRLSGKHYSGNIIICSDQFIQIDASTELKDVMLFAPGIKIGEGFKGNLQAFATDSILVNDSVNLAYPSALGLFKMDFKVTQPFIYLGKNTSLTGLVFTNQTVFDLSQTLIHIDKNSTIMGQVYADGFVELKGTVLGNVTCNKFILKTPSSIYENHLLDAVVDHTKLSTHFVGSSLIDSREEKAIIKWLE